MAESVSRWLVLQGMPPLLATLSPGPVSAVSGPLESTVERRDRLVGVPDKRTVGLGVGVVAGGAADLASVRTKDGADQLIGCRVPEDVALVALGSLTVALAEPAFASSLVSHESRVGQSDAGTQRAAGQETGRRKAGWKGQVGRKLRPEPWGRIAHKVGFHQRREVAKTWRSFRSMG